MFARFSLALLAATVAQAARAEDAKPAASAPAPRVATPSPGATAPAPNAAAAPAPPVALSESKFLSTLYSEIAKHTPQTSPAGAGEVTASFHVNAQGKIDKVTIDKTTSPALAEAVKKILASVAAPPPPGGSMDVGQTFKFHAGEAR